MVSLDDKSEARTDSGPAKMLPLLGSILRWKRKSATNSPEGVPADGDLRGAQVESGSLDRISLPIDRGEQMIGHAIHAGESSPAASPATLMPADLHRLYSGTSVPQHRYLAPSLTEAVNSPEIAPDPAKWLTGISEVDLSSVVGAWLSTNRSTDYEQLSGIELDPAGSRLTAVLTVKRGSGYSGGPSTAGSREYVAFWVDWGSGFHYEGTVSVAVHDFGSLPPVGLEYYVALPIDLVPHWQPSGGSAKTVKVRAVLSWNTPPSTTDPKAPVVWGNSMESHLTIQPGQTVRVGDRVPSFTGAAKIDPATGGGRIVDATIKALAGMALGAHAGLTVVPESAIAVPGAADRTFAKEMEGGSNSVTLYVWDQTPANHRAASRLHLVPA